VEDAGRLVARTLKAHGVEVVFALCGDHTNAIFEGCAAEGVRIVDARDERGAAWMACGYALSTATTGVVLVTGGPGLTNAVTALADAQATGIPLVCITGGVALAQRGQGHPGDLDQIAVVRPVSKWSATVTSPDDAGETLAAAFGHARAGRPGVAVVEIPVDVQLQPATVDAPEPLPFDAPEPDPETIAAARAALAAAQRPIALAGSGAFWSGAADALLAFVERARIPLFTIRGGRGIVPDEHELCFGFPNFLSGPAQIAYGEADVVLVLGTKLDLMLADVADVRRTVEALTDGFVALPTEEWLARLEGMARALGGRGG
jgi:acetolactate synthase I/II/III large subunit